MPPVNEADGEGPKPYWPPIPGGPLPYRPPSALDGCARVGCIVGLVLVVLFMAAMAVLGYMMRGVSMTSTDPVDWDGVAAEASLGTERIRMTWSDMPSADYELVCERIVEDGSTAATSLMADDYGVAPRDTVHVEYLFREECVGP